MPLPPALRTSPVALGALLSLISVAAAAATAGLLHLTLGEERMGRSAAQGLLSMAEPWLFIYAVILIPALETVTGQLAPIELLRWMRAPAPVCIVGSAALFGVGHYVNGGLGHGLTSLVSGLVFAAAYMALRKQSVGRGLACAWVAHACHNGLFLYAMAGLSATLAATGEA